MITFENIRSGEVVSFDGSMDPNARQAHLAAYLNSSNMSPNASKGQDFGWRLAPEIIVKIDNIKQDLPTLDMLSRRLGVPVDEIRDFHILNYVAEQDFAAESMTKRQTVEDSSHEDDYKARIKALKEGGQPAPAVRPRAVRNTQTTEEVPAVVKNGVEGLEFPVTDGVTIVEAAPAVKKSAKAAAKTDK